jgi:hypothetical protein
MNKKIDNSPCERALDLILPFALRAKQMLSYAIALLISVGITCSFYINTLHDKRVESNKEIMSLMYLQDKAQMNAEDFIKEVTKKSPQEYCSTIANLDVQQTCRLTLDKNHEVEWLIDKIVFYIAFASLLSFCFFSLSCYFATKQIFPTHWLPEIAFSLCFSVLVLTFPLILNNKL